MPVSKDQFWASIVCEGEKLEEYIQKPDKSTAEHLQRFVESQAGKQYQPNFGSSRSKGAPYDFKVRLFIDGRDMKMNYMATKGSKTFPIYGVKSQDRTVLAPFQFSKIETCESDDEEMVSDAATLEKLGTIKFVFTKCVFKEKKKEHLDGGNEIKQVDLMKVSEKSKKLSTEMTSYGPAKKIPPKQTRHAIASQERGPFLTITFHYLSGALLELRGIKPDATKSAAAATSSSQNLAPSTSSNLNAKSKSTQSKSISLSSPDPSNVNVKPKVPSKRKHDENSKGDVIVLGDETSDEDEKPDVGMKGKKNKGKKVKK